MGKRDKLRAAHIKREMREVASRAEEDRKRHMLAECRDEIAEIEAEARADERAVILATVHDAMLDAGLTHDVRKRLAEAISARVERDLRTHAKGGE